MAAAMAASTAVVSPLTASVAAKDLSSNGAFSTTRASLFVKQVSAKTVCSAVVPEDAFSQKASKVAASLALAALISTAPLVVPEEAQAGYAGLTPCKESAAFAKREKASIKKLNSRLKKYEAGSAPALAIEAQIEKTKKRFSVYGNEGLLCGTDGLPHLIVDGNREHLGEFVFPGILFLYIAGWIGWVGRSYLVEVRNSAKPTEKEIIIDVPLASRYVVVSV
eukprot:TRINITY_DN1476_c0_g1_i2.p1 TRINITY_DN1476_c0_g1~~TRINITY_DN1476_c0_g1_i2.p1  ORF type:complete len:222 (+),score=67.49 TRINITY_DN1476_c0_g1_i2:183-848(+)